DAPDVDEGSQAIPAPVHAPPTLPPATAFDGNFQGSCPVVFERRTRQTIRDASTSTAQQDEQQPDL
ncbi:hypothetical protein Tco_0916820, partial [Tanacetum coccineum]